jgi:hypothetical protein
MPAKNLILQTKIWMALPIMPPRILGKRLEELK